MSEFKDKTDYRAVARDLLKLCKKHKVKFWACDEGYVAFGSADAKFAEDLCYSEFSATPTEVFFGDKDDSNCVHLRADGTGG